MKKTDDHRMACAVDFHTHLLPGMDDGSASAAESRAMLDCMRAQGITAAVLTPHFYPERESPDEFCMRREAADAALQAVLLPSDPTLYMGAEVAYYEGIGASSELPKLCIRGTSCILIELPFEKSFCSTVYRDMEMVVNRGFCVIIAHVERYPACRSKAVRRHLMDMGLLLQSNAESFITRSTAGRMRRLLDRGEIHFLGSDCHHETHRVPNLGVAVDVLSKYGRTEQLQQIYERSCRILGGAVPLKSAH